MKDQSLYELIILIITVVLGSVSIIINKFKLSKKNNKMLKIIDTLMAIAEFTDLKGEDKKQFVMDAFKDFKLGKVDNVEEYINDKIDLVNQVGIKPSLVNEVISEELEEQSRLMDLEHKQKMFGVHSEEDAKIVIQLEQELDIAKQELDKVSERLDHINDLYEGRGNEVLKLSSEVDRLKGVEVELGRRCVEVKNENDKLLIENEDLKRELENTKNLLQMRESQLRGRV